MRKTRAMQVLALCCALAFGIAACGGGGQGAGGGSAGNLSGTITVDGSSTVFPLAQAAAEQFMQQNPGVQVTVGQSGTGGGFEKFCAGETDIADASRPIEDDEQQACQDKGVQYEELTVGNDGIAVVTNPALKVDCLTISELEQLWRPDNPVSNLNRIDSRLPDQEVNLYGPGTDSGTFDFFTEKVVGEEGRSRSDYQASEDDNVLVQGIAGDKAALGYFGFSFYEQNREQLNLVGIKADDQSGDCVKPTPDNIQSGEYPLARPVFMYPSGQALQEPAVRAFMEFIIQNNEQIAEAAQIVPLTAEQKQEALQKLQALSGAAGTATTTGGTETAP